MLYTAIIYGAKQIFLNISVSYIHGKKNQIHFTTKTKEGIPKRITGIRENFNKHPNEDGNFLVQKVLLFTSTLAAHGSVVLNSFLSAPKDCKEESPIPPS